MFQSDELPPIEKAEKYGFSALTPSELLAIILRSGTPGTPITRLTKALMEKNEWKLKVLERRSIRELMETKGIGKVKAFQIEAMLEIMRRYNMEKFGDRIFIKNSVNIYDFMKGEASKEPVENIWIILLNGQNAVIERRVVSSGGSMATVFDLKVILRHVLTTPGVESVIMVHNHPSGNLRPSPQDDEITRSLKEGCKFVGLRLLDHVIVTSDSFYSYADNGRL